MKNIIFKKTESFVGRNTSVDGANIPIVHYVDHGYLEEEKSMIHSFAVTFGAKYLTGMVTSVPPYETFSLLKNNILHRYFYPRSRFKVLKAHSFCRQYMVFVERWSLIGDLINIDN
jgi:hypothetical protein